MSKQVQVNLAFNADTAKAKAQINELVASLNKISMKDSQIFDDRELREAANAAKDLTTHLQNAVNVNTGKLDLNKFSQSLSQSKQSLSDLYTSLSKAGPQGQQAFLQLASSIAASESQVLNLSSKVKDLGQTLKNTVKWQLSSSLVHGFMGAMQHAIGYAKDLNSSLNDIRIVTGASVEEMAKFAEQANKSAKALSATTTEYTKASLIYYQQGLSDAEVKERTDVTIKMANVSKESAVTVSDQMTAVWNNFYDGSKSLEYYADVMTALGAATASSVDEIAGGLEKFAAIGDTIGLSYEYAAAALATITSNTRESEEVVGTALKTIFARIQGLSLGETLDDGTNLNKYSQALEKVGISIFDQAGELKAMDNILAELGGKWQTLSKDQQTALAQTVAGVRQYTQLIALMDNWDSGDSDSFMANLNTAYNSEGALQEQQEIYAQSWEAAADRVTAATEDIYDSLINDKAIVVLLNGLEKVLNFTGALIDGFGGLKGILLVIGGIFAKQFSNEIPGVVEKLKNNFDILTGKAQAKKIKDVQDSKTLIDTELSNDVYSGANKIRAEATSKELQAQLQLEASRDRLSLSEQKAIENKIKEYHASQELIASKQEEIDLEEEKFKKQKRDLTKNLTGKVGDINSNRQKEINNMDQQLANLDDQIQDISNDIINLEKKKELDLISPEEIAQLNELEEELEQCSNEYNKLEEQRRILSSNLSDFNSAGYNQNNSIGAAVRQEMSTLEELYKQREDQWRFMEDFGGQSKKWDGWISGIGKIDDLKKQRAEVDKLKISIEGYSKILSNMDNSLKFDDITRELKKIAESTEDPIEAANKMKEAFNTWASGGTVFSELTQEGHEAGIITQELADQIRKAEYRLEMLSPESFEKLKAAAEQAGVSVSEYTYRLQQAQTQQELMSNLPTDFGDDSIAFSEGLGRVAGFAMDLGGLFAELQAMITTCFDESATAGEKFIAVLTGIPMALFSISQVIQSANALIPVFKAIGGALSGTAIAGTTMGQTLIGVFTGVNVTAGTLLATLGWVALAIAAIVGVVWLVVKAFEAWKASTPEGKLEAAKEATSAMATAAQDATTAYQNLLNTISGYDSAIAALENLDAGTQEFTNALITANEKAWELIDTYGLIQGQDWDYGKNGEVIINDSAKSRITDEANERRENAIVGQSAAAIREKEAAYNVAKDEAGYWGSNLTEDARQNLYDMLGFTDGTSGHISSKWSQAETDDDFKAIIDEVGKKYYGDEWDSNNADMVDFIRSSIANMEKIGNMFDAYNDLQRTEANERQKMLSTSLSDEEAYQNSNWKNLILDTLNTQYEDEKKRADSRWDNQGEDAKTDTDIEKAFAEYLGDQNYTQKDGKVYDKEGNEITELSDLSIDAQRNILAAADAISVLEEQGIHLAESFNQVATTMSEDEAAFAKAIIDNDISSLTEDQIKYLQAMGDIALTDLFDADTVAMIENNPVLLEAITGWLDNLEQAVADWKPPQFDLEQWKSDYAASKDIVSGLKVGDTIDQSEYDQLDAAAQQFFTNTGDGIYTLTQNAELLRDVVNDIAAQALKDEIAEINDLGGMFQKTANQHASNIEAGNAAGMAFLNSGSDEAYIEDVNAKYGTSFTEFAEAVAYVNERLGELQSNLASTADQLGELDNLMASGQISSGDYVNQLQVLATQYENCADELANYQRALEEGNEEAANAADAALHGAIRAGELAKQYDLSAEAIERYAEELKDSGKYANASSKALVEMAKDQLRFDRAVENSRKNMKQWKQDLQIAAKTGHLASESAEQMAEAYGDLLDIDGNLLPSSFLKDVDNLKLMEQALKGDEEAYQSLLDKSRQAIAMKIGLDDAAFQNGFNDLLNKYYQAQSLDDIQVGASLDNAGFLQGLTDMVNAANMTAAEATSYLASMGVDAEVVEEPTVSEDTQTYVSATPNISWHSSAGTNPVTGGPALYTFPEVSYSTSTETIPTSKTTTGVALRVTSANKSSGGAVKHGGSSAAASPSSGGGGGGGGSKPKEPTHAEKKNDSDKTRYHTLQNQLEDLTAEYDALADASDRAFGQNKLDAIDAEIEKTDELIKKQEEYVQAIQADLPVDKSIMQAYYQDLIGGSIQFDENGNISNYDQIQDAMYNKYNQMTSLDEDSEEWQVFEKKYEQLEKYIEQYEETYDLLREEEANYQDLLNQRIDLELEKVEYKVEIELAVPENQKEVIEYQLGRIEDDAKKTGEALALLTEQAEMTYDQILINKQGLNDALELSLSAAEITEVMAGNMDVLNDKTFTEDQISAIQDYKDNLLELNEEFDEIRESIEETVLEAFDMWHEKLEEGIEKFDYFGTILESYQSIIDIVGKDTLGISDSLINTLSQASVDNAINEVEATRDAYKALQQAQIDAERELEKAKARGDEQSISFWESTLNEIQQNAEDAHEEMLDSWEEALNKIVEQFEASIQTAVDAFNEAVYQLGGIEALSEEFDRQKEMADMYLDDYQKIYELSKLNRDVNNSIDDTDSLAGKQKLKKLLGEINKLQADGVKMSEYDLEYLQAEYDLRLAEIALEEAQRAKDVVRLSRDNEGNWSYVYTQNTDAVDEAQQKYEDALYAMQDLSSNYIDEISAQLIETSQEMQEALAAIRIEDYASIEEYYEEVERVQEQYQEQLAMQEEELNKAVANNKELYDTDWTNYHNAVGYKISDTEEFATKFSDTLLGTLMNSESDTSNFTNILADATSTLMGELYGAAEQYYTNMAAAMEAAGTTTGTFADDLATNVDQIKEDSEEAATAVEDMAEHMQEQMDNIINKVGEWQRTYGEAMNEIINANLAVIDSFNEMLATLSMDDSTVTVKYDIQNHNSDVLDAERFATGGYTGSWGNTGRLGILDEKELILNKDDTENFIEALKISRSMLNTIDLNAQQASLGLGTLIPTTIKDDIRETLEQVVQITAEFPNATDHNEIQEAFNSLINYSSQYANRK